MESQQSNQPGAGKSFFERFWRNVKSLQEYEWVILTFIFLLGFLFFLAGFIIQLKNPDIGHAIMAFAVVITLESITTTFNHFVIEKKNKVAIEEKAKAIQKELSDEIIQRMQKELDNLSKIIVGRMAGTQHIMDNGIYNVFEGLNLNTVLEKCTETTVILQRLYFSPREFDILERHLLDLIINKNCKVKILLLAPMRKDIIEDRVKNCLTYKTSIGFEVNNISDLMRKQLKKLLEIIERLPENKKNDLEVKLHCDYTIAAITGYHDVIITGLYLNEYTADEGFQEMKKGRTSKLYRIWLNQFMKHWDNAVPADYGNLDIDLTGTYN